MREGLSGLYALGGAEQVESAPIHLSAIVCLRAAWVALSKHNAAISACEIRVDYASQGMRLAVGDGRLVAILQP